VENKRDSYLKILSCFNFEVEDFKNQFLSNLDRISDDFEEYLAEK
jgi:hypothetical protein